MHVGTFIFFRGDSLRRSLRSAELMGGFRFEQKLAKVAKINRELVGLNNLSHVLCALGDLLFNLPCGHMLPTHFAIIATFCLIRVTPPCTTADVRQNLVAASIADRLYCKPCWWLPKTSGTKRRTLAALAAAFSGGTSIDAATVNAAVICKDL